jgi:hypothetical protein
MTRGASTMGMCLGIFAKGRPGGVDVDPGGYLNISYRLQRLLVIMCKVVLIL